jgi:hypothetical protein
MARSEGRRASSFGADAPPSAPRRRRRTRAALAACVAALLPLAVACNSVIGLSDFTKGECAGARCGDGGELPDQVVDGGADVRLDALPDVKGADPVSWAKWPMPNYDGGAITLPNPLVYSILDANRVEDTVTGLVWRRSVLAADATQAEASAACAALDRATGPWRLPKRIELVTLLDFSRTSILIDPALTGVKNVRVWTSSESRPIKVAPGAYWTVSFETGSVDVLSAELVAKVLCVRAK